jgi:hypothetical protein
MAVKHMNYLDIPVEQRREAAAVARKRLHDHLSSPVLTPDQAATIHSKLVEIDKWEAGELSVSSLDPEVNVTRSTSHVVSLTEGVKVKEN